MDTGELKLVVVQSLAELTEASVHEIIQYIASIRGRDYAYSTIATILNRLENEMIVTSEKKRKSNRKKTYFRLTENAHKKEASSFLREYVTKFGDVGIRHLSNIMGSDVDEGELEHLREKFMQ